ncbi:MAG TPA: hypothetical protein ENH84_06735 [Phycisphaerae bacterium]|nr:hypothetical protein [Phycisphaerae bacterium]
MILMRLMSATTTIPFKDKPTEDIIPSLYFGAHPFYSGATFPLKRDESHTSGDDTEYLDQHGGQTSSGRKHIPFTQTNWDDWDPQFFHSGSVDTAELEPYEKWKNTTQKNIPWDGVAAN